jgi:hypothetical protein
LSTSVNSVNIDKQIAGITFVKMFFTL